MTTIEGNKLIAEFMGLKIGEAKYSYRPGVIESLKEKHLAYHTSWDWLMPVVKKVWEISADIDSNYKHESPYHKGFYDLPIHKLYIHSNIDTVWSGVVDFIQWYNNNKH